MTIAPRRRAPWAAVLALLVVAGCEPADEAGALRLWAMGSEGDAAAALAPAFEAAHPGLHVDVQRIPWSAAHEKLLTAWVGGAMPDVVQVGNTWIPELVVLGALEPLDARLPRADRDDVFPGVLDTNVVDGRLWGVPWYVDTRVLFYRADLFAAAGVPAAPRTWDDLARALAAVKAADGADRSPILLPLTEWQPLVIMAFARGAALLRDDDTRGDFASPAFRAALAFYVDLFRRGLAPLGGAATSANLYRDFARGDVASVVTGPWNLGEFARRLPAAVQTRWATAPMPAAGDAPPPGPSLAGGASLVVVRGTPRADAAWELVAWLTASAQVLRLHALTGDLPARRSAWRDPALADEPHVAAFHAQLQSVRATPKIPEWERIAAKVSQYAEAAVRDEMTIDAALAALDADVDDILAKRRWLRHAERGEGRGG